MLIYGLLYVSLKFSLNIWCVHFILFYFKQDEWYLLCKIYQIINAYQVYTWMMDIVCVTLGTLWAIYLIMQYILISFVNIQFCARYIFINDGWSDNCSLLLNTVTDITIRKLKESFMIKSFCMLNIAQKEHHHKNKRD